MGEAGALEDLGTDATIERLDFDAEPSDTGTKAAPPLSPDAKSKAALLIDNFISASIGVSLIEDNNNMERMIKFTFLMKILVAIERA